MPDDAVSITQRAGLTAAEAAARLVSEGRNELARAGKRPAWRIALEVMREPMLMLLLGGGVVYLLIGDLKEALILLAFALLSVAITVVQEARTERVLEALRDLTSPRALVIRDGERQRIAGAEVVPGDLVVLEEGDRVPADGRLLQDSDLQIDESLLTGESVPVPKSASGDDKDVASGSLVVRGTGLAEVTATGPNSQIGRIGASLNTLQTEAPRLQKETRKLVTLFASVAGVVCIAVVLLYGLLRGGWLQAILSGIALGMSMLPEEFPVVLTIFMAMGAWRISKAGVLTRRAAAIETLGSATVLCTDKTGTLTENRMSVAQLWQPGGVAVPVSDAALPAGLVDLALYGRLGSAQDPFDPMEKAFHVLAGRVDAGGTGKAAERALIQSYGLRPELLAMTQVWQVGERRLVAAKGSPEAIAELCHLDEAARAEVTSAMDAMAAKGLRVLAVARADIAGDLPESQHDFVFAFLGLVGLADPLRPSVPEAVRQCTEAGIRVVMITGDYPVTALAIARQAGLTADAVVTGDALAAMDDAALKACLGTATVFARIAPEQKLRIVEAFKARGDVVAMTGDGVNDAPSLKSAHIGIAMGGRGTDVAREASAIVLLNDDFGSIVTAVALGRRIYDNLRKAMGFIFAVHLPIAGLALLPLIFGLPILFGPVHIAFLEMVIDPVCSLVFEAESAEDDVMRRKPRAPDAPLFSRSMIIWSLFQGVFTLAVVAAVFLVGLRLGMATDEVRALTFFALVLSFVSLIFVNRAFSASVLTALRRRNRMLIYVLIAVPAMLALTLLWPAARDLFGFARLSWIELGVSLGAAVVVMVGLEISKVAWHRLARSQYTG